MTKTCIVKALGEKLTTEPKQVQAFSMLFLKWQQSKPARPASSRSQGWASWSKWKRKERMGRNLQAGEEINIAPKTTVKSGLQRLRRMRSHGQRSSVQLGRKLLEMNIVR